MYFQIIIFSFTRDSILVAMFRQPIKLILIVENVIGLYRNFIYFGKIHQCFIILRTFFEIYMVLASFASRINFNLSLITTKFFHYYASFLYSVIILFLTIYHSKSFKKLLLHINTFNNYFTADQVYINKLNFLKKGIIFTIIYYITLKCVLIIWYNVYYSSRDKNVPVYNIMHYLFMVNSFICAFRIIFEFTVISCLIMLQAEQVDCVTRAINKEITHRVQQQNVDQTFGIQIQHQFDKWSAAYVTISKISKLCILIFGLQVGALLPCVR